MKNFIIIMIFIVLPIARGIYMNVYFYPAEQKRAEEYNQPFLKAQNDLYDQQFRDEIQRLKDKNDYFEMTGHWKEYGLSDWDREKLEKWRNTP